MRKTIFLILVLFAASPEVFAQDDVDSLARQARSERDPVRKVDQLNELSSRLYDLDLTRAYETAQEARKLAESIDYTDGLRYALILNAFHFEGNGSYRDALRLLRESLSLSGDADDLRAYNLAMIANVFTDIAQYDSAESYYRQAIQIEDSIGSDRHLPYAYKNLARLYSMQWRNEEAMDYFGRALALYVNRGHFWGMADTWYSMGQLKRHLSDYTAASDYIAKACELQNRVDDDFVRLYCFINQGEINLDLGQYDAALKDLFKAVDAIKGYDLPNVQARIYEDLGQVYEALGQNAVGLQYFLEALKLSERIGVLYQVANTQTLISFIYKNQRNFPVAHQYINQALAIRRQIGDRNGIAHSLNGLGLILLEEKRYGEAMSAFEQSLQIRRALGNKGLISTSLFNMASVLQEQKKYKEALAMHQEVLKIEREIGSKYNLSIAYNTLARLYIRMRDMKRALETLTLAEKMSEDVGSQSLSMDILDSWSQYYEVRGDFRKALEYHKRYAVLNDSIYSDKSAGKLAEMQALYQLEKKDNQIKLLSQEKMINENEIALQRSRINMQTIAIISIVVVLMLVSLLTLTAYRYNRRIRRANVEIKEQKEEIQSQSEELMEANTTIANINRELESKIEHRTLALMQAYKELDTFFYRSSHDFRRPLTTFLGLAEVANVTVKDPNALELFEKVKHTAMNLDKMLVKLQSISDVGAQELVFKAVLLKEIFDSVCGGFRDDIHRKGIRVTFDNRMLRPLISYPAMIKTIIENLFENSINFSTQEDPYIRMTAFDSGEYATIDIQDNGQGIAREYQDKVFDMYFRGSDRSKGNGLGLYIVKKAVEKLDGSITLSSLPGAGATFTIMIPNRRAVSQ